jgi:hypothetical protein
MKTTRGSPSGQHNPRDQKTQLPPMEASEAAEGFRKANGRKPDALQHSFAEAERAMRDALMGCYNGWPEQPDRLEGHPER